MCPECKIKDKRKRRWPIASAAKLYLIVNKTNKTIVLPIVIFAEGYRGVLSLTPESRASWCGGREFVLTSLKVSASCSSYVHMFSSTSTKTSSLS